MLMEHQLFEGNDLSLACGLPLVLHFVWYVHPGVLTTAIEAGVFSAIWSLFERAIPEPMSAEWWLATNAVVDVRSVYAYSVVVTMANVKKMSSTVIEKSVLPSSWWGPLLAESMRMMKINASVGLSARETMPAWAFAFHGQVVETAAKHQSQHALLLESSVASSLEAGGGGHDRRLVALDAAGVGGAFALDAAGLTRLISSANCSAAAFCCGAACSSKLSC